jgi:mRNA interferase MazF
MTKGKVVLIPFPFDDLAASKVRPALCLTDSIGPHHHVILAFISSQANNDKVPSDFLLDPRHSDFKATGLRVVSVLRLHRLVTLTSSMIVRELGVLSPQWQTEIDKRLTVLFELSGHIPDRS